MLNDERRSVEEAYTAASNSSSLRVMADRPGDGDFIIAAGWSPSRVGMALLRLHSEWDAAAKPRKPTPETVSALAASLPSHQPAYVISAARLGEHIKADAARRHALASAQAAGWYSREVLNLIGKLGSLPAVRQQLVGYVPQWGIREAADKVPAVIAYWLAQACVPCNGLKFIRSQHAAVLSARMCKMCNGTGKATAPHGGEGKRVANYMDDCVSRAQASLKNRLRNLQSAK